MKRVIQITMLSFLVVLTAYPATADELFIYPTKGQNHEQMEKDKYDCYQWAKGQTGFDPMVQPKATAPPPQQQARRGGALHGAAAGAAIGGIAGGSDGAAEGAAIGALVGGMARRNQMKQKAYNQEQWEQEQAAIYQKNRERYNRAYGACLEGKGYTVK